MSDSSGVGGPTSASRNDQGGGNSGGNVGMTAQQTRLQQMITLQHAHSDSMRKDYVTRTSSLGGDASSSSPGNANDTREDPSNSPRVPIPAANSSMRTFAATERGVTSERSRAGAAGQQQRNPISPPTPVNPNISTMDPSLLTSLSMATPTLSNVSFAGAAGGGGSANNAGAGDVLRRNTSSGGGRTAEYAKLLPGGQNSSSRMKGGHRQQRGNSTSGGGSGKNNNGGNIHYQDYSQHRQQMSQTQQGSMHETTVGMTSLDRSLQLQQQNVGPPHQPQLSHDSASVQFHDALSHASIETYGSTAASGGGGGGYHQVPQSMGGANFNIGASHSSSHHQFHYGDPSHAFDNDYSHNYGYPYHDDPSDNHCICCKCCRSCGPENLLQADNLHRSLCFGAIDGMLTGSGITAACAGLGILTTSPAASALWAVVALCLAACASDGVCMCLGHAWSTFVLQRASIAEKSEEKQNFDRDRASSKARLVDMLLGRGMLKIDAMSVADTLEGYPDIFVSALVGDAGALGPGGGSLHGGSADNLGKVKSHGSAGALLSGPRATYQPRQSGWKIFFALRFIVWTV